MDGCLFCDMANGKIPVSRVIESEQAFVIHDINPRAPHHLLIIPRQHIGDAREIEFSHAELLVGLFTLARDAARIEGVIESGYRLAFNVGDAAGMTIPHLHMHLLGGRRLGPEG
jgi:histidine triad (HIT) family protein